MSLSGRLSGSAAFGLQRSTSLRRGTNAELRGSVELALVACDEADAIAQARFRRDLELTRKPDRTFATATQQAIEQRIRERIQGVHLDGGAGPPQLCRRQARPSTQVRMAPSGQAMHGRHRGREG